MPTDYDIDQIFSDIQEVIQGQVALIDKYGLILASNMPGAPKESLISPTIWNAMISREKIANELQFEMIRSIILHTDAGNLVICFGAQIYLFVLIPFEAELSKILPVLENYMGNLEKLQAQEKVLKFKEPSLGQDIEALKNMHKDPEFQEDRFPIFKHLIKHMVKK